MALSERDRSGARQAALLASLSQCPLFAAAASEDLDALAGVCRGIRLEKDQYLFRENNPAEGFFVVRSGAINVHRVGATGKEVVIRVFRPPESFAEAVLATGQGYPADARAVGPSEVLLVPRQAFVDLVRRKPEMALRMLASMSLHLRSLVSRLDDLQLKDIETRLLVWLLGRLKEAGRASGTVEIPGTKRSLALELGVTSETLSRTFAALRGRKLIRVSGTSLEVRDRVGLEALLKERLGGFGRPLFGG